jgi:hypothetical protein
VCDEELAFLIKWAERIRAAGDLNIRKILDEDDSKALRFYVLSYLYSTEQRQPRGAEGFPIEHPHGRGIGGALVNCLTDQLAEMLPIDEAAELQAMSFERRHERVKHLLAVPLKVERVLVH